MRIFPLLICGLLLASCTNDPAGAPLRASGTLETVEVNVSAKVPGQIVTMNAEEGIAVREGDVLAVIDRSTLDIQHRQAGAGVALAEAQLALLLSGARAEDIRSAEETLTQAEASLAQAQTDFARLERLLSASSVTKKQRDDAETRLTVARAQTEAARENLSKMRRLARPEEIRAARARLDQARALTDLIAKQIADCTVTAPVAGTITRVPLEAGETAASGSVLATIARLEQVHVRVYLSEREVPAVRLGSQAAVVVDAYPGRAFPGTVTWISPTAEFTPKNVQTKEDRVKLVFAVKVELDNPDGLLKPGVYADVEIPRASIGK
jgi:HlyD family secretion protein